MLRCSRLGGGRQEDSGGAAGRCPPGGQVAGSSAAPRLGLDVSRQQRRDSHVGAPDPCDLATPGTFGCTPRLLVLTRSGREVSVPLRPPPQRGRCMAGPWAWPGPPSHAAASGGTRQQLRSCEQTVEGCGREARGVPGRPCGGCQLLPSSCRLQRYVRSTRDMASVLSEAARGRVGVSTVTERPSRSSARQKSAHPPPRDRTQCRRGARRPVPLTRRRTPRLLTSQLRDTPHQQRGGDSCVCSVNVNEALELSV